MVWRISLNMLFKVQPPSFLEYLTTRLSIVRPHLLVRMSKIKYTPLSEYHETASDEGKHELALFTLSRSAFSRARWIIHSRAVLVFALVLIFTLVGGFTYFDKGPFLQRPARSRNIQKIWPKSQCLQFLRSGDIGNLTSRLI